MSNKSCEVFSHDRCLCPKRLVDFEPCNHILVSICFAVQEEDPDGLELGPALRHPLEFQSADLVAHEPDTMFEGLSNI